MEEKKVYISAISCKHCIATIEREIGDIDGVESVEGNVTEKTVRIQWSSPANWEQIQETLEEIGYTPAEK